ncbi:prepilin-type N-terminal cleavage/methylation domain-containing protein [Bacillus sp. AFS040349]|uniref:prepilin-type N-terminal cleavage/methylation domain-containing protein n=1 Tax=Bacillus sp. AFS040349 TaxID=2033502 RepID=UPI000BFE6B39|nr:prepilin-type N-terminal cleavage/methylation domain-containing protein [Bacillus sp. AFS040349]PGT88165.1 prepilin-type cleavage/methylation domain-containing protein [Bacillus sp. AFS040349]
MLKKLMKNERGLTLIELLAVVVILGIIAAIAIPAIGGMIANSKADAHIANAKQIANAARLYTTTGDKIGTDGVTLGALITAGHLESIKDPNGDSTNPNYSETGTKVTVDNTAKPTKFYVTLVGDNDTTTYITHTATQKTDAKDLQRSNVTNYK